MNKTHTTESMEQRLDEINEHKNNKQLFSTTDREIKAFIRREIETHDAGLKERIEGMIAEHTHDDEYCGPNHDQHSRMFEEIAIYNNALRDVLSLFSQGYEK